MQIIKFRFSIINIIQLIRNAFNQKHFSRYLNEIGVLEPI